MSIFIGDNKVAGIGNPGRTGKPGESAYEIAKKYGYEGTEEEFALELSNAATKPDWFEEDENSPAFIKNKPETFESAIPNWDQNDPNEEGYIENRPFYDSRESVTTEKVVVNTVAGPMGIVKLADAPLNIDLSAIKSISSESNTWLQFDNEPISAVEVVDGLYFIVLDVWGYEIGIYFESMDALNQLGLPPEWFDGPGLYFIEVADEGENISLDYNFTIESGKLVQLDSKFIKEMYSDNSGDKDIIPLQTIEVENVNWERGLGYNYPLKEGVTYNIIFDNIEYKLTANKFNSYSNKIYLGNLHLEDGIGPIDTGEPFIIVYNMGSMYAKSAIGEHTVYVNGYVNDINKVDIKYSDVVNKTEKIIFSHDNIVADGTHYLCDEIILGECTVIFDGVEERLIFEGTDYSYADGSNFSIKTGWNNIHNTLWFYCDDEEPHSLVIKQNKYYIKKDLLSNSNWNQNDPNEMDYIKNRTHWIGDSPKYLLEYQGISGFYQKQNSIYGATWGSYDFALKEGDLYTIIWDNAEYTLTCKEHNNMLYLGNVNYVDMQRGGDIPFALVYNAEQPGAYSWLTESTSKEHYWELLHHDNSTIHHLDSKFIKDMYYEEPDRKIVYENTLRFFRSKWEYYQSATLSFNLGESYYVTWDGTEYLCDVKEDNNGELYLGNNAICTYYYYSFNEIIDTGEPFFITSYIMEVPESLTSHSISIALKLRDNSIVHKIDPKYLPDGIGGIKNQKTSDMTQLVGIGEDGLAYASNIFDGIILKDAGNGYEYIGEMYNGIFTTYCRCDHIEVTQMPNKTEYVVGDAFNPDGMIIAVIAKDGTIRTVENYTYQSKIEDGMNSISIQYIEAGMAYSTNVNISLREMDPALDLIDFDYIDNGDGTYTLTG